MDLTCLSTNRPFVLNILIPKNYSLITKALLRLLHRQQFVPEPQEPLPVT